MKLIKKSDKLTENLCRAQVELSKALDYIDLLVASAYDCRSTVAEQIGLHLTEVVERIEEVARLIESRETA